MTLETFHTILAVGLVLANVAVWYGVYLEQDKFPAATQHRGWRILLIGLAAEAALGLLLVGVDFAAQRQHDEELARVGLEAANANERAELLRRDNLELFRALTPRRLIPPCGCEELKPLFSALAGPPEDTL